MSEVLKPEVIQPKKATTADRAISWMCDHWQKNKPGNFRDRENTIVNEDGQEAQVEEQDLEIVREVVGLYENSRKEGNIVLKEKNPLGENVNDVSLMFLGDTHLPGGNLEEEVYEKNQPYIFLKKVRALFVGVKKEVEAAKETEPNEYSKIKKALRDLKIHLQAAYKILKSKDGEMDQLRDEIREEDGIDSFNAFLALKNAFIKHIKSEREGFSDNSKVMIVHVGDNISNEQKMGDVAYSAAQLEELRRDINSYAGVDTVFSKTQGNHDTDLINYGLEHDAFDRELFGSQVFLQEVGDDLVILSLNTNLYSTFWHQHLERRKASLQERIGKVVEMEGGEERNKLEEINERELAALGFIRQEMETQRKLVQEAKNSGKRIILMGHEKGYLEQAMGDSIENTKVVAVVSGHDHRHDHSEGKNSAGETINYLNVGEKKVEGEEGKKSVFSGFFMKVKDSEADGLVIDIKEIVPDELDRQEAIYSM